MNPNEQLISQIINDLAAGLYPDTEQAIVDFMAAGLPLQVAALNVIMMAGVHATGGSAPKLPYCPVNPRGTQSCEERVRQLAYLGYL